METLMIALGIAGTALVITVYFMMQHDRVDPKGFWFSALNGLGAILIFASIAYDFDPADLGGLLVEGAWFAVSSYGMVRALRARRAAAVGN